MNRLGVKLLGLVLLLGCGGAGFWNSDSCLDDSQCGNDQVCFRDGCGDPGKNLVVEVTPNPQEGLFAQDFPLTNLKEPQVLELSGRSTIQGQVLVRGGGTTPSGYAATVTLNATGESLLLPGVRRQGKSDQRLGDLGSYTLAVGSGRYTVNLFTSDLDLPPLAGQCNVAPGGTARLDFLLPSPMDVVRLNNQVLRFDGQPPARDLSLEVQVVDANLLPRSQRATVSPENGFFSLNILRSDLATLGLSLLVTSNKNPLVSQVRFPLSTELPSSPFLLADYGSPVVLRGRVVDREGRPVAGATLSLSGQGEGGGLYRGAQVQSQADGQFELLTLPSAPTGPSRELRLAIIPPESSSAGSTELTLIVPRVSNRELGDVSCLERRKVSGTVLNPENQPASAVQVEATLLQELKDQPRPSASHVVAPRRTDDTGRYALALDPGVYRFDFIPVDNLPRFSRIIIVRPAGASAEPQDVSVSLPRGRHITGSVRLTGEPSARMFAPNASLRFYRQVAVDGQPSALLLLETSTDPQGVFSATLPLP